MARDPHRPGRLGWEMTEKIPEIKDKIVALIRVGMKQSVIAETVEISTKTIKVWREADKEFDERCNEAHEAYIDLFDAEYADRALYGSEEVQLDPRTRQIVMDRRHMDPKTGISTVPLVIRRKNDATLQWYLRHQRPEIYGEKKEINNNVSFDVDAVRAELRRKLSRLAAEEDSSLASEEDHSSGK